MNTCVSVLCHILHTFLILRSLPVLPSSLCSYSPPCSWQFSPTGCMTSCHEPSCCPWAPPRSPPPACWWGWRGSTGSWSYWGCWLLVVCLSVGKLTDTVQSSAELQSLFPGLSVEVWLQNCFLLPPGELLMESSAGVFIMVMDWHLSSVST